MRWLAVTLALLGLSAALAGGVYLRDRDPSNWLPPQRVAAAQDAETIMRVIACPSAICSYRLVGNPRPDHWLARVSIGRVWVCFDIDLLAFDVAAVHGFTGAKPVRCTAAELNSGA